MADKAWLLVLALTLFINSTATDNGDSELSIDPLLLSQLSAYLKSNECYRLCLFFAMQTSNPSDSRARLGCALVNSRVLPPSFSCLSTLREWNERVLLAQAKDMLDRIEYAEDLLEIGLKRSNRTDLSSWLKGIFLEKHHLENEALNQDFQRHRLAGKRELLSEISEDVDSGITSSTTETAADLEEDNFVFYIKLLVGAGVLVILAIVVIIVVVKSRKPKRKPKPKLPNKLTATDTETEQSESEEDPLI